jgi:hypothetical protein
VGLENFTNGLLRRLNNVLNVCVRWMSIGQILCTERALSSHRHKNICICQVYVREKSTHTYLTENPLAKRHVWRPKWRQTAHLFLRYPTTLLRLHGLYIWSLKFIRIILKSLLPTSYATQRVTQGNVTTAYFKTSTKNISMSYRAGNTHKVRRC